LKTITLILILLAQIAAVSTAVTFSVDAETYTPILKVQPQQFIAPHLYVYETFTVNVTINEVDATSKLVGVEFRLSFNDTLLEVVDCVEGSFLAQFDQGLGTWFSYYVEENGRGPNVLVGNLLFPNATGGYPGPFPEGSGTIATITFKEIYQPIEPEPSTYCVLELFETMLVDSDNNEITHEIQNGYYKVLSLQVPTLIVQPDVYGASEKGEVFDINVTISDLDVQWRAPSVQFRLCYNDTLLEVVNVTEGPFMKDPRWNLYGTFFFYYIEPDGLYGPHVLVGIVLRPDTTGQYTKFPEGGGTLATITFKAIHDVPVYPSPPVIYPLSLKDTLIPSVDLTLVEHSTKNGTYQALFIPTGFYTPIDVDVDVGSIHFRGEITEFYILVTEFGKTVNATNIKASLYFNGAFYADLSVLVQHIDTGLYRIPYSIPIDASTGTYTLVVKSECFNVEGNSLKNFLISSTLTDWDASLIDIKDEIATVIVPNLGEIKANLTAINAKLVSIDGKLATIETSLGLINADLTAINARLISLEETTAVINSSVGVLITEVTNIGLNVTDIVGDVAIIQTSLGTIEGKITTIEGDIATIETDLGTVKTDVSDVKDDVSDATSDITGSLGTLTALMYVAIVLALIAAIGAALSVIYARKK